MTSEFAVVRELPVDVTDTPTAAETHVKMATGST